MMANPVIRAAFKLPAAALVDRLGRCRDSITLVVTFSFSSFSSYFLFFFFFFFLFFEHGITVTP